MTDKMDGLIPDIKMDLHVQQIANSDYKLVHWDKNSSHLRLGVIETEYNAKYVGEFSIKNGSKGFINAPCSVFYNEKPHPQGSNYFAFLYRPSPLLNGQEAGNWVITDAISAADNVWTGVFNEETGQILYSAYRHDYQTVDGVMADGGAEYLRSSNHPSMRFKIVDGEIVLLFKEQHQKLLEDKRDDS